MWRRADLTRTWVWGSIMSGQRLALATMMPLSMEKESLGRPAIPQARMSTGSPREAVREKVALLGIPEAALSCTHLPTTCKQSHVRRQPARHVVPLFSHGSHCVHFLAFHSDGKLQRPC